MKIGIIGGGMMGLALGQKLGTAGHQVSIFEAAQQLGGLATHHDYGDFFWDRFYHVIVPTDENLIRFLGDIGLADKLRWSDTRTGFYLDREMHEMSRTMDFLKFKPLGWIDKFRLGLAILYCSRIKNWERLQDITVEEWLIKVCGRRAYEKMWKPLLLAKLGESYKRVSAVFIWTYMARTYAARTSSDNQEQLGYVSGGYRAVFERLASRIRDTGGEIRTNVAVESIERTPGAGISVKTADAAPENFDKIIFTAPVNVLEKTTSRELASISGDYRRVSYLGVVCAVLVLRKPAMPYYIVNIADSRVPFTGAIGVSNVVSPDETAGKHLLYLPRYVLSSDPWLRKPDEEIRETFLEGLRVLFPDFDQSNVEAVHVNRAFKVQPLQILNYSKYVPTIRTHDPDFYVLNTSQFVNVTLNNNSVISHVERFLASHAQDFAEGAGPHAGDELQEENRGASLSDG